jgi:hypothetical protein
LYATSGSSGQNGIKADASAFGHTSKAGYWNAVREGFAGCDNPAVQSVASASNENWIEESAYRQKDSDSIKSCAARRRTGQLQNKPACATILPTHTAIEHSVDSGYCQKRSRASTAAATGTAQATRGRLAVGMVKDRHVLMERPAIPVMTPQWVIAIRYESF